MGAFIRISSSIWPTLISKVVNGYHKSAVPKTPIKKVKYDTVHKRIQRTGNFIV